MGLETGDYISDLVETNPLGTDNVSQGDDHVRLIKHILKTQFPNLNAAVTATPAELNSGGVPAGCIMALGGPTVPSGWLDCDGADVSRTTYADLFNVIGTTWGAGNGSTTFTLPQLAGRVLARESTGNPIGSYVGKNTWTANDMPAHTHRLMEFTNVTGNYNRKSIDLVDNASLAAYWTDEGDPLTESVGTGGDNRQATAIVKYMIKT